jgi:hypothetical protein
MEFVNGGRATRQSSQRLMPANVALTVVGVSQLSHFDFLT